MEDFYKYNRAFFLRFRTVGSETYLKNYVFPSIVSLLDESGMDAICVEEDENGQDCMILFLEEIKINGFLNFCNDENIIEYHADISHRLLIHDNLEEVILKMIRSDEFYQIFKKYKSKNHTTDTLLEKISLNSEESLEPFEIEILQNLVAKNRTNNLHK